MNIEDINIFVSSMTYDFETVRYLEDNGRDKETVPIIDLICERILFFQNSYNEGGGRKGVFDKNFWKNQFNKGITVDDLRIKVKDLSGQWSKIDDQDLKQIEYKRFVRVLRAWTFKNLADLKKGAKSARRKRFEKSVIFVTCFLVITSIFMAFVCRNWGLKADFYEGMNFEKYIFTGYERTLNFSNPYEMDFRLPHDFFSARYQGYLLAPKDGEYDITVISDDGAKVFIDGKPLIIDWKGHSSKKVSHKVFLYRGKHKIMVEYFQFNAEAILKLYWSINDGKMEIIPAWYLRHD